MLKLKKPVISATQVYSDCVSTVKNKDLKNKLLACKPLIIQAETELEQKITKGKIYTIKREKVVNANVSCEELKKVYTGQMLKKALGRSHYNKLLADVPLLLCPICAHRDVSNLDHYLPKTLYPRLTVVPVNLIPTCKDCNTGKLSAYPLTSEQETLHPYYDDIEKVMWLKTRVNKTNPVSIHFFVQQSATWDNLLFERVKYHFASFNLRQLYSVQAARKLVGMRQQIIEISDAGGIADLKKYLTSQANSISAINLNSWEAALLRGLNDDDWFCSEGFRQI